MIRFTPPRTQLLKWVGNKQKFALEISNYFPEKFNTFFEPFLGSGAISATVSPEKGIASDTFAPLMEIWQALSDSPEELIRWYEERRNRIVADNKVEVYESIKKSFNENPNGADFIFLSRACYGGIVRFRKRDGYMSTPCGAHTPISVEAFSKRVYEWKDRMKNISFMKADYKEAFALAQKGDLIYCDPPYSHSQSILYGAQDFDLNTLMEEIQKAKSRGVYVALSIDGTKKSGDKKCLIEYPEGLFENEVFINCGHSMLRRFQMKEKNMENEHVADRLLLTY